MDNMYFRRCNGMVHKVKPGETMYNLSRMYNVSIDELISSNPGVNVYNMQAGDEVCIPIPDTRPEYINDDNAVREFGRNSNRTMKEDFYEMVKRFDK